MLLETQNLVIQYEKAPAVKGVSLQIEQGEVVTLIGSNGAGKSSVLRAISGLEPALSGSIHFTGQRIDGMPPQKIVGLGIALVPEGRKIWPHMSSWDNLRMGAFLRKDPAGVRRDLEMVCGHFPILGKRASQLAGSLSGGEQQMLAIGRALMSRPKLLLLDEPSLGLSPIMVQEIAEVIRELNARDGVSILLVEQNARLALRLATRGYVLVTGCVQLQGSSNDLLNNDFVRRLYLGEG